MAGASINGEYSTKWNRQDFGLIIRHFVVVEEGVVVRSQVKQHVRRCSLNLESRVGRVCACVKGA